MDLYIYLDRSCFQELVEKIHIQIKTRTFFNSLRKKSYKYYIKYLAMYVAF